MSGKSTFLRTVGVNVVLAQSINTCLARVYRAPVYQVRSCIGRSDDLIAGKSYYLVEVEAVLALRESERAAAPHLFIFDELFRGTNAVERIAAAEAVLVHSSRVASRTSCSPRRTTASSSICCATATRSVTSAMPWTGWPDLRLSPHARAGDEP